MADGVHAARARWHRPVYNRIVNAWSRAGWGSLFALLAATQCGVWGCGGPPARADLRSGNPLDRARGVVAVTEARDDVAVHKLVDLLDDSDRAVRMYAILALVRLCGEDYGYRYYESAARRGPAVQRWREALRKGEVTLRAGMRRAAPGPAPDPPSPKPDKVDAGAGMGGAAP